MKFRVSTRRQLMVGLGKAATLALAMDLPGAQAAIPAVAAMAGKPDFDTGRFDLRAQGYRMQEFSVEGRAVSYEFAALPREGEDRQFRIEGSRHYKIRVVVLTPADPAKFNGTVAVEWLNVSTGGDIGADWILLHRALIRDGYGYIGVSAQTEGIEGSPFPGLNVALKKAKPVRYAELFHPGDAYSFDIFSRVGRVLRQSPETLLGGLAPRRILAMGYSQSAIYLATYVNEVDRLARVYDGFLIHGRPGTAAELDGASIFDGSATQLRTAVRLEHPRVPVLQLISETELTGIGDFIGFYAARQPDNARLRTWEVAGAAHGDNYSFGAAGAIDTPELPIAEFAAAWAPVRIPGRTQPMNNGPQLHYVGEAALAALNRWVTTRMPPPSGAPIELSAGDPPAIVLDANGNAFGGVRTPWMDVPVNRLSGVGNMAGASTAFDQARLERLYPGGREEYLRKFEAALDRAIAAGFILARDRKEILELAEFSFP